MLSLTCVAVISVTGSELSMSVMNSDRSKALMAAKAGAEAAAQQLDNMVGQIQENSRIYAANTIQQEIDTCTTGSALDGIIDPTTHAVINEEAQKILDQRRDDYFKTEFNNEIRTQLTDYIKQITSYSAIQVGGTNAFYFYPAAKIEPLAEAKVIDLTTEITTVTGIRLVSTGQSEKLKRSIQVEFSFLDKKSIGTEVPVTYGNLTQLSVSSTKNKNDILNKKALVAKGNIISIDGKATINGDVYSFGTIPVDADGKEMLSDTSGHGYGGIMAGITQDVWDNSNIIGLKNNDYLRGKLNLSNNPVDPNYYFTNRYGSLTINGSASTMSYVHSLFALAEAQTGETSASAIEISEDTYARAVMLEKEAKGSEMKLKNVYVTDDIRIQSDKSKVEIGKWDAYGVNDPAITGTAIGLEPGILSDTRSSAIVVGGDSQLWINGSVYMGGSTMFNEYTSQASPESKYISGISVLKSDSMPADAFKLYDETQMDLTTRPAFTFPNNIFYLYNSNSKSYININDPDETNGYVLQTEKYDFKPELGTPSAIDMMGGCAGPIIDGVDLSVFDVLRKGMHFKYIWDKFWGNDKFIDSIKYYAKVGTEDIKITTNPDGDIVGWCSGAVAANGTIYGSYKYNGGNGFTDTPTDYSLKTASAKKAYLNKMNLFLNLNSMSDTEQGTALKDNVTPQMSLSQSALDVDALLDNQMIGTSDPFIFKSSANVVLGPDSIQTDTGANESRTGGYSRGIIYSSKDIYVKAGTEFRGMLIAEGNIVFLGDATVTYDENIIDTLISRNMNVSKFFKTTVKTIDLKNNTVKTTRLANVKNIKIKLWKEI